MHNIKQEQHDGGLLSCQGLRIASYTRKTPGVSPGETPGEERIVIQSPRQKTGSFQGKPRGNAVIWDFFDFWGFTRGNPGAQLFTRGKCTFAWFSPGVSLVSPWGNPGVTKMSVSSGFPRFSPGFLLVFPRGIPVFPWGKLGEDQGKTSRSAKVRWGHAFSESQLPAFPWGFPGESRHSCLSPGGLPAFPWGKPAFQNSENPEFWILAWPGFWVG